MNDIIGEPLYCETCERNVNILVDGRCYDCYRAWRDTLEALDTTDLDEPLGLGE